MWIVAPIYLIIIQAGKNGWTIIYADHSTDFKDIISSANENFEEAYNLAVNRLGTLAEIIVYWEEKEEGRPPST